MKKQRAHKRSPMPLSYGQKMVKAARDVRGKDTPDPRAVRGKDTPDPRAKVTAWLNSNDCNQDRENW